jgi:hypothetical protein
MIAATTKQPHVGREFDFHSIPRYCAGFCDVRQVYKYLEILVPSRSMVLKVVTGKILETLELRGVWRLAVPFWNRLQNCTGSNGFSHLGSGSVSSN